MLVCFRCELSQSALQVMCGKHILAAVALIYHNHGWIWRYRMEPEKTVGVREPNSKQCKRTWHRMKFFIRLTNGILKQKPKKPNKMKRNLKRVAMQCKPVEPLVAVAPLKCISLKRRRRRSEFFFKSKQKCVEFLLVHAFIGCAPSKSRITWRCSDLWHGSPYTIAVWFLHWRIEHSTNRHCLCIYE